MFTDKDDLAEEAINWTFVNHTKREDKMQGSLGGIKKAVSAVHGQKQRPGCFKSKYLLSCSVRKHLQITALNKIQISNFMGLLLNHGDTV